MRKPIIASLTLLVICSVTFAQEHRERTSPSEKPPQSQRPPQTATQQAQRPGLRYTSTEGRYAAWFPKQPNLSTQQSNTADGKPLTQYLAIAGDDQSLVMVGYFDYPADIVFSLDKARDGVVNSVNGTQLEEHSISLGGSPGRQIKVAAKTAQGLEVVTRVRFYDVNRRVYILQCMVPKVLDSAAAAEKCEQFFDSFRVRTMQ